MTTATKPAVEVCRGIDLSDEGAKLLSGNPTGQQFFDALNKAGLYTDAVRVLARLLAPRDGVWWGCLCAWAVGRSPAGEASIQAAVRWLQDPTDAHRRAAGDAGKTAGPATAAGMVGTAAFLAEGSMSPAGQTDVPTKPELTPKLVSSAVLAAARSSGAAATAPHLRQYLAIGVDVFRGTNRWTTSA